jgi:hypothetical protein
VGAGVCASLEAGLAEAAVSVPVDGSPSASPPKHSTRPTAHTLEEYGIRSEVRKHFSKQIYSMFVHQILAACEQMRTIVNRVQCTLADKRDGQL